MSVSPILAILRQTPLALSALLGGLPEDLLAANEGPDTFSPRDVVGHLLFGEETDWVPRVRIIHGFGTGTLRNYVHHFLKNSDLVERFEFAPDTQGGHGATIAELKQ